jgi:hypothetical protein
MTFRVLFPVLAAALAAAQTAPPTTGTSSIEGTVVNDATNEPVKKAQVSLFGPVPGKQPMAVTDASGSFAFHKLPAGTYTVNATKEGFDQNRAMMLGDNQKQVTVTADQHKSGVELRLPPTGAISGRLTDENGDPAPNCTVGAQDASSLGGASWQQRGGGQTQTDDHGEYRIPNLPAGRYVVYQHCYQTLAAPHGFMEHGDPRTPLWAWVPGLYGGAATGSGASTVAVHGGEEVRGVDFRLKTTDAFSVPIALVPDNPGLDLRNVSVRLMPRDPAMAQAAQYRVGRMNNGGTWRAAGVVPGSYVAIADFQQGESRWHGETPVEVGDTPPELVNLPLTAAMTLSGDLEVESGNAPASGPSGPPGTVFLTPLDSSRGGPFPHAQSGADGRFTIEGVIPGRYQLQVMGPVNSIQSVTFGGHEVSPRAIDIGAGAGGSLHVVISVKQVALQVSLSGLQADRPAWVFLLPKGIPEPGPGSNPPMSQALQSPLTITAAPGEYVVNAIECAQPWPLLNSMAGFHAIASLGKAVEVKDGENASVTLDVMGREDLKRGLDRELE